MHRLVAILFIVLGLTSLYLAIISYDLQEFTLLLAVFVVSIVAAMWAITRRST